jgi:hypothetical protein
LVSDTRFFLLTEQVSHFQIIACDDDLFTAVLRSSTNDKKLKAVKHKNCHQYFTARASKPYLKYYKFLTKPEIGAFSQQFRRPTYATSQQIL